MAQYENIREMRSGDEDFIISGIKAIQAHECKLHTTRLPPEEMPSQNYFEEILDHCRNKDGKILVISSNDSTDLIGFIAFWIEEGTSILETNCSNTYGYVSDIFVI